MSSLNEMIENTYYHIYNYGNNLNNIFYDDENYYYFLKKFDFYLSDFFDVFAFCLLPNQFHFLVKVKNNEIYLNDTNLNIKDNDTKIKKIIMQERIRIFFMAYSKSINKMYARKGSLFQKNFRRQKIETLDNLKKYIFYIHFLPEQNGLTHDFRDYKFSSYNRFITDKKTKIKINQIIKWYNGIKNFIEYHDDLSNIKNMVDNSDI